MLAPGTTVADTAVRMEARSASEANFILDEFQLWRNEELACGVNFILSPLNAYIRIIDGS